MKLFLRLLGVCLLLGCAQAAWSQPAGPKVDRVDIQYVGPKSVSEQFVRANIRLKAGDIYHPNLTEDDIHSLYGTGGSSKNFRMTVSPVFPRPRLRRQEFQSFQARERCRRFNNHWGMNCI